MHFSGLFLLGWLVFWFILCLVVAEIKWDKMVFLADLKNSLFGNSLEKSPLS